MENNAPEQNDETTLKLELYKVSREQIKSYGDMRWKRLTTYLTSTALLFAALAFAMEKLGIMLCLTISSIGIVYTLCFLAIEIRAGWTLRAWVDESHRLEKVLGGETQHVSRLRTPSQQKSFRYMYGLFVFGWLGVFMVLFVRLWTKLMCILEMLEISCPSGGA